MLAHLLAASSLEQAPLVGLFIAVGAVLGGGVAALIKFRTTGSTLQSETLAAYRADKALKEEQIQELKEENRQLRGEVTGLHREVARLTEMVTQKAPVEQLAREVAEMRQEINDGVQALTDCMDEIKTALA